MVCEKSNERRFVAVSMAVFALGCLGAAAVMGLAGYDIRQLALLLLVVSVAFTVVFGFYPLIKGMAHDV